MWQRMMRDRAVRGMRGFAALVVGAAVLGGAAAPAQAQFRGGGMNWREMLDPSISSRDLDRMAEMLTLSDDQKAVADDLLAGFQSQYQEMASKLRETFDGARQEFQETRDPSVWRELRPVMDKAQEQIKTIETAFFGDLKAVLEPVQLEKFPAFERARKREKSLQTGFLSGETVDIVRMVEDLKLPADARAALAPVLAQYETEIEKALAERDALYEEGMSQGMDLWQSGQMDKMNEMFNKSRDAGAKVRDINRRFARQVESALPEGEQARAASEFRERSFPRIYRDGYLRRAIETAKKMDDLTAEQRAQVETIAREYERESSGINTRWAEALEKSEMSRTIMQMFGGGGQSEEVRTAQQARRELDDKALEQLREQLTEEQRDKLPERQNQDWRRNWREGAGV